MKRNFDLHTPEVNSSAYIDPTALLIGQVEVGKDSSIWPYVVLRGDIQKIVIAKGTNIQELTSVHVGHSCSNELEHGVSTIIGNKVTVGHKCILHACTIEDACLIGMGATILDGAHIKKESIVAAGSLVTKNKKYPPRSLIMGSPAKFVRELTEDEVSSLYESAANYIKLKNKYIEQTVLNSNK